MTKRIPQIVTVAVIACALCPSVIAQQVQGQPSRQAYGGSIIGGPPGNVAHLLLQVEEVGKMLALTAEQKTALRQTLPITGASPLLPQVSGATIEDRARLQIQNVNLQWTLVHKILNDEQQTKFKEIYFQANNGLDSPTLDTRILDAVGLTADQKEKITKLEVDHAMEIFAAAFTGTGQNPTPDELAISRAAVMERNKKYTDQIKSLLTAEQRAQAEKLTAEIPAQRKRLGLPPLPQPRVAVDGR